MSAQRSVPSAAAPGSTVRVIAALLLGVAVGAALALLVTASANIASLGSRSCAEIVWTPDGKRVAFVIDGSEMSIYDAQSGKLAGTVRLLTNEAAQTRLARGITFSENGRAATFDDCPRGHSGCRAGVVGVPQ